MVLGGIGGIGGISGTVNVPRILVGAPRLEYVICGTRGTYRVDLLGRCKVDLGVMG